MRTLYEALIHKRAGHVVLGRKLRPFSNWHRLQLEARQSPLIGGPGEIDVAALAEACAICVTRYPETLRPPRWYEAIRHARACHRAATNLAPELLAWKFYTKDYVALPQVFSKQHAKACQCPAPFAMWAALKTRGFSKAEAWDEPVGEAAWEKLALAEAEGAEINLLTDKARKAMLAAGWGKIMPELIEEDE